MTGCVLKVHCDWVGIVYCDWVGIEGTVSVTGWVFSDLVEGY